jgi:phenylpyruvate tautomerase PptA (4-oxalocrotonate tautomerase family)
MNHNWDEKKRENEKQELLEEITRSIDEFFGSDDS